MSLAGSMQRRGEGVEDVFYAPKEEECVGGIQMGLNEGDIDAVEVKCDA